ncbi:MAG: cobalt chelatase, partial [Syntrophales bacterium]|nr:cobalt chelatase [Syntrophales bacterium]
MKIFTIMWSSYLPLIKEAAESLNLDLTSYSSKQLNMRSECLAEALRAMKTADLILLYRTNDAFWDDIEAELNHLKKRIPVVVVGSDPSLWTASTVHPEMVATAYNYLLFNGRENIANMLRFLLHQLFDEPQTFKEPDQIPWQAIHH